MRSVITSLCIVVAVHYSVFAEAPVSVNAELSSSEITVGDTITLDLTITVAGDLESYEIDDPIFPEPARLKILSTGLTVRKLVTDSLPVTETVRSVHYLVLDTGRVVIPPIDFSYFDKTTEDLVALQTNELTATVRGTGDGSRRVRDLVALGGLVVVVIVITVVVYLRVQRIRRETALESEDPAAEFGARLQKCKLKVAHGKREEAQILLHDGLRGYLADSHSVAFEADGSIDDKTATNVPKPMYDIYIQLNEILDDLKFGKKAADEDTLFEMIQELQKTLEQSR